ncbi:fibronectin type III domain-containing protein, partial [Bacteriovoracaceae bacterium]|nr:fibronectin type III domain-containing protein [Bacteriovoracaceae bacterium]
MVILNKFNKLLISVLFITNLFYGCISDEQEETTEAVLEENKAGIVQQVSSIEITNQKKDLFVNSKSLSIDFIVIDKTAKEICFTQTKSFQSCEAWSNILTNSGRTKFELPSTTQDGPFTLYVYTRSTGNAPNYAGAVSSILDTEVANPVDIVSDDDLTITWDPVVDDLSGVSHYSVALCVVEGCQSGCIYSISTDKPIATLPSLKSYSSFHLCVKTVDNAGNTSAPLKTSSSNYFGALSTAAANVTSDTQITLTWSVSDTLLTTDQFIVKYDTKEVTDCTLGQKVLPYSDRSVTIENLKADTLYYFALCVANTKSTLVTEPLFLLQKSGIIVEPRYRNAKKWNDYYVSTDLSNQNANPCNANATDPECLHGGEAKKVVTSQTSCDELTLTDSAGVFNWSCEIVSGFATFFTNDFIDGKGLSDLIETDGSGFKEISVSYAGSSTGESAAAIWWSNPIVKNPPAGSLDVESSIYVITKDTVTNGYIIGADKVALVSLPGTDLSPGNITFFCDISGGATAAIVCSSLNDFTWLEVNTLGDADNPVTFQLMLSKQNFTRIHNSALLNITS